MILPKLFSWFLDHYSLAELDSADLCRVFFQDFWKISFGKSLTKIGILCTPPYKFILEGPFNNRRWRLLGAVQAGQWIVSGQLPTTFRERPKKFPGFFADFSRKFVGGVHKIPICVRDFPKEIFQKILIKKRELY